MADAGVRLDARRVKRTTEEDRSGGVSSQLPSSSKGRGPAASDPRGAGAAAPGLAPRWPQLQGATDALERALGLMDGAVRVPGTRFRIGLDPIMGLLAPTVGDAVGGVMSLAVVLIAVQYQLPLRAIALMVFNIMLDTTLGSIPLLGDAFDLVWKSNERNLRLLNAHRSRPPASRGRGRSWLYGLGVAGLILLGLACLALPFVLVGWLLSTLFQ